MGTTLGVCTVASNYWPGGVIGRLAGAMDVVRGILGNVDPISIRASRSDVVEVQIEDKDFERLFAGLEVNIESGCEYDHMHLDYASDVFNLHPPFRISCCKKSQPVFIGTRVIPGPEQSVQAERSNGSKCG